jgi:hypothetical protein
MAPLVHVYRLKHSLKACLFPTTAATFVFESFHKLLSLDFRSAINASFEPTDSALMVLVLSSLPLIFSLNCMLSVALMQQCVRWYQAQCHGALQRHGQMRAYIFDGINKSEMARVVAAMSTFLHLSHFLLFAALADFLFSIYRAVSYATLSSIMAFALACATFPILLNIYFNCSHRTLSGFTWRIYTISALGFLWSLCENHEDSSDGLWLACHSEAERQETEVAKSWLRDGNGIPTFVSPGSLCISTV